MRGESGQAFDMVYDYDIINDSSQDPIEWRIIPGLSPYSETIAAMEKRVDAIITHELPEAIWLLEHPSLYTLGTSGNTHDILDQAIPSFQTGRGGQVTYHGPGQRIVYVMLDLRKRQKDIRAFVHQLEAWIIACLKHYDLDGHIYTDRIGVWIENPAQQQAKIAAIGIRIRKWVTFHGFAINVSPDLSFYQGIIPCGIRLHGNTSMAAQGIQAPMENIDQIMKKTFSQFF